ncbi:hypothetical protein FRC10_008730 [Ceratobasidium sp. 414]|nr:hypothetical protein FRC10_008730 [Ceratobasidium sp. 414]
MFARSIRLFSTRVPTQSLSDAAHGCIQPLIDVATLSHPTLAELANLPAHSFVVYPQFLSTDEQAVLLKSALAKLRGKRRRRSSPGHFDGVIRDYREMTVSAWPSSSPAGLADVLLRLYRLVDPQHTPADPGITTPPNVQTHVLHLASTGLILPHVDNVEASGSMIAGVSLGDTRVLRMSRDRETFDVLLESGDHLRYRWKHEIPNPATFRDRVVGNGGQRLSVVLRDKYNPTPDRTSVYPV